MIIKGIRLQSTMLVLFLAATARGWPSSLDPTLGKALTESELPFSLAVRSGLREFVPARPVPLSDIFFAADASTTVRLHNLRVASAPRLGVLELVPDLSLLSVELTADLGSMRVLGDCGDHYRGNITVTLVSVAVSGVVSLGVAGDAFQARGVELDYEPQEVVVRVTYFGSNGTAVTNQFSDDSIQGSLAAPFFDDLTYQLDELLRRQFGGVLRNISVSELLGDANLAMAFAQYTQDLGESLNEITDGVLMAVGGLLREQGQESVPVPDMNREVSPRGEFTAAGGSFRSVASLQRAADVSVARLAEGLVVSCALRLSEARLAFERYEARVQRERTAGALAATLASTTLTLHASLDTTRGGCKARLRRLRLAHFGDVRLEELRPSWLGAQVATWLAGVVKGAVAPEMERRLAAAVEQALGHFHCGLDDAS